MSSSIKAPNFVMSLVVALAALGAALVLALFVPGSPAVAGSTDLVVTKTADTNDGACSFSDCSLREAIIYSNTVDADAIDVPAGTYKLTRPGRGEDLAATGDLDIRRGVTIRGEGARNTIIDGNGIDRVFHMPVNPPNPFTLFIFGVKITGGNTSEPGGGIFHDAQGSTLHLGRSTVSGNQAVSDTATIGGGIAAQRGPLTIVESTISGNKAPGGQGGGIFISGPAPNTITNTTVSGNQSRFGGGVEIYEPVKISDSTIAFNTAQQPGGGLHVGGGAGPYTLKNSIVSNNTSNFAGFMNCGSDSIVDSEGNNLEKGTSCGLDQPTDINADPMLGKLQNYGGPTNTRALLRGSPAINAGGDPFPPTDQRGVTRAQGMANDIGAFEKRQEINVVQCPTGGTGADDCIGTNDRDALIGRDGAFDHIQGGGGDDTYNGKGSCDALDDSSLTSSDRYVVTVVDFCNVGISSLSIQDDGGNSDVLDLSRFYASTDFVFEIGFTNLHMDEPNTVNDIDVLDFFTPSGGPTNSIDTFKFSDRTLSAQQVRAMIQ